VNHIVKNYDSLSGIEQTFSLVIEVISLLKKTILFAFPILFSIRSIVSFLSNSTAFLSFISIQGKFYGVPSKGRKEKYRKGKMPKTKTMQMSLDRNGENESVLKYKAPSASPSILHVHFHLSFFFRHFSFRYFSIIPFWAGLYL